MGAFSLGLGVRPWGGRGPGLDACASRLQVNDVGLKASLARCSGLTSLNLTGLAEVTDEGVAALLGLTRLRRLALCCTGIGDAALDYLTYYTRFAEAATPHPNPDPNPGPRTLDPLTPTQPQPQPQPQPYP